MLNIMNIPLHYDTLAQITADDELKYVVNAFEVDFENVVCDVSKFKVDQSNLTPWLNLNKFELLGDVCIFESNKSELRKCNTYYMDMNYGNDGVEGILTKNVLLIAELI